MTKDELEDRIYDGVSELINSVSADRYSIVKSIIKNANELLELEEIEAEQAYENFTERFYGGEIQTLAEQQEEAKKVK